MYPVHILHLLRSVGQGLVTQIVVAEEFVQFPEAFVIAGKACIQQLIIPPEFYPGNRFNPLIGTDLDELHDPCGVVDIGESQRLHPAAHGLVNEFFHRKGAVAQGII